MGAGECAKCIEEKRGKGKEKEKKRRKERKEKKRKGATLLKKIKKGKGEISVFWNFCPQ